MDEAGLAKAARRAIDDLRKEGKHERGWVSVNRVGNRLNQDGNWKDRFSYPKRRPLYEALTDAGLNVEQTETGSYQVKINR